MFSINQMIFTGLGNLDDQDLLHFCSSILMERDRKLTYKKDHFYVIFIK